MNISQETNYSQQTISQATSPQRPLSRESTLINWRGCLK